jgi:hypothetical protein
MLLAAPALHATPVYAPQVGVPEAYPDPGDVPIPDSVEGTFSFGSGAGLLSGRYEQGVLVDPFNKTCMGCLDFFIRLELDAVLSNNIFTLETGLFPWHSSVPLDIGYVTATGRAPALASRDEAGMIRYLFGNQVRPGREFRSDARQRQAACAQQQRQVIEQVGTLALLLRRAARSLREWAGGVPALGQLRQALQIRQAAVTKAGGGAAVACRPVRADLQQQAVKVAVRGAGYDVEMIPRGLAFLLHTPP